MSIYFAIIVVTFITGCDTINHTSHTDTQTVVDDNVTFQAVCSSDTLSMQGPNSINVYLENENGPISDAILTATPTMPGHGGHGTSVQPIVTADGEGNYEITDLIFTMPGTWQIEVNAEFIDESTATADLFYAIN
jgi:hypothetical protein